MRDYGKVCSQFWTGKTGRKLRGDPISQVVALYLVTSPHSNMIGAYYCPLAYIANDTGLTTEGALKGLMKLVSEGFCEYDQETDWVWVKEMARFQIADTLKPNDNLVISIRKEYGQLPVGGIKDGFFQRYSMAYHISPPISDPPGKKAPLKGVSKPLGSQEQEQEQDSKESSANAEEGVAIAPPPPAAAGLRLVTSPCPYETIVTLYHEVLPELRVCKTLTETRKGYLRQRWAAKPGTDLAKWRAFFEYVKTCPFLLGQSDGSHGRPPFVADLEWLVKPSNYAKIVEGKYEPGQGVAHG